MFIISPSSGSRSLELRVGAFGKEENGQRDINDDKWLFFSRVCSLKKKKTIRVQLFGLYSNRFL